MVRPRSVYIDSDCDSIDNVKSGHLRSLFDHEFLIAGKENASGCFSRARNIAKKRQDEYIDVVRKIAEECNQGLQGFITH